MKGLKIAVALLIVGPVLAIVATMFVASLFAIVGISRYVGLQQLATAAAVVLSAFSSAR
jgi:hypothetical protein